MRRTALSFWIPAFYVELTAYLAIRDGVMESVERSVRLTGWEVL